MEQPVRKRRITALVCTSLIVIGFPGYVNSASAESAGESADAGTRSDCTEGYYDECIKTTDGDPGAHISAKWNGDKVVVCDVDSDDKRAVGLVYVRRGGSFKHKYTLYDTKNDNHCEVVTGSAGPRWNLPEGRRIRLKICLDDDPGPNKFCRKKDAYNRN